MITVNVTNGTKVITDLKKDLGQRVRLVAEDLFTELKRFTPIKSGRARRGWSLSGGKNKYRATNRLPYIERLDRGYSKQSPEGITRPSIRAVVNKRQRRFD